MAESVKKPKAEKAKAEAKPRKSPSKKATANGQPMQLVSPSPSHEQVAELARKYWAERGFEDGHHEEDWFRAEQELRAKAS